jgi:hypothetical protein
VTPGQPGDRRIRRSRTSRGLALLLALSAVLLVVQAAMEDPPGRLERLDSAVLFATALAVAVAQRQWVGTQRAHLTITSEWGEAGRTVRLVNEGKEAATIVGVWFDNDNDRNLTLPALKERLHAYGGWRDGVDYTITNFTEGAAVGAGESLILAECSEAFVDKVEHLTFVVRYETAGDIYEKRASLLPYPGATNPPEAR